MGDVKNRENDDWSWLSQAAWRRWGLGTLIVAAGMAIYAVAGGLLEDTAIHAARAVAEPGAEGPKPNHGVVFLAVYWCFFALTILVALYCAVLDLRFIRLQYAIAKKALVYENFQDRAIQDALSTDKENPDRG